MPRIQVGNWVEDVVNFCRDHFLWLFNFISDVISGMYDGVNHVLSGPSALLMAGILAVIAVWLRGLLPGALAFVGFALIDSIEQWDAAMSTLSLVLVASVITIVLAVPLGIWAARKRSTSAVVRPILDFMQTMPAFVYLIPGISFFGVGQVPGIIATIVFSMPPGVRMTELGIRQVDEELVEAADAFGTTPRNTLLRVQLPLALPTIMAGINQVIMLALSMVVIAGMVGGGGLGAVVFEGIDRVNVGLGFEGGLAVVILAMYLDRITSALNQRVSPLGRRALAKINSLQGAKLWHYRPNTAVAAVGVVVLALVAGGMSVFSDDSGSSIPEAQNIGHGRSVDMGYIAWDEGIATTYLWKEILEERGFKPKATSYDPGALYAGMADGKIDFQTDSWLPTLHKSYWQKYGKDLSDLGTWYDQTTLEISVPSYVKGVHSLSDLKGKSKEFGGRIIGIEPGAGEMDVFKNKVMPGYGLDKEYTLTTGSTSSMLAQLQRSIKAHQPVAVVLWTPHWAYSKYSLTKLKDPKGLFGKGDQLHATGAKDFPKKEPEIAKWLKNFHMTPNQLNSLEAQIQTAGKGNEQEGVKKWLDKNPGLVDKWAPTGSAGSQRGKDAGAGPKIGYFPWDEDIAVSYLWKAVLEDRGYKPTVTNYDPGAMFAALAGGQSDVNMDAWLPTLHKNYWDKYHNALSDVGPWYSQTTLEISVPSYVKGVHSLSDLKGKSKEFGGRIIGIEPGAGEMDVFKKKVMPGYGLDKEYTLTTGSTASMLAQLQRDIKAHKPVAVMLWTPHWAYSTYSLTKLKDPKGLFGKGDQLHTVGSKDFPKKYPEVARWMKNFHMTPNQLNSLEAQIQRGGQGHEEDSARAWMAANHEFVSKMAPVS